jgi:hypothetical protein
MDTTKMRELAGLVAKLSDEQRAEIAAKTPVITIERHSLSVRNAILCMYQIPSVTVVGGFRQWLAAGRCVRKGERAAYIMHPCTKKGNDGEDGGVFFRFAPIFDISQTEELTT